MDQTAQLENKPEPCPFCGGPAEKRLTDGPRRGFIGCFTCMIGLPFNAPYGDKEIAAWNSRAKQPPMCAVHAALDRGDALVLEVGNDCIACSLHERTQLLNLLEPFAADDGSQDSLTVLRGILASAAPSPSSPVPPEALARASKLCRSTIPGARVELIFQNLQDAQVVHKWLCNLNTPAATPTPVEQEPK